MAKETRKKKVMKRICAWCNKIMQDGTEPATHGICRPCGRRVIEHYETRTVGLLH
jgi:rRNA maturation endonuclease Nob1